MKDKKAKDGIIEAAKKCLEKHLERESDNISRAEEAIRFRSGEQWPEAIKKDRENPQQDGGPQPCPVMDKTNQYVRQVVNEMRQNRAAIKFRPVDDKADKKVAEVFTGITRHIEDASEAIEAYATAGEQAIDGGFGYFRLITEYCDPMSFYQDIRIKRIPNRFSVALGFHLEPDGADAREGLIWEDMDKDVFESTYPKAKLDGFDSDGGWETDDTIRVAEYFKLSPTTLKIHLMPDGSTWTSEKLAEIGVDESQAIQSRETTTLNLKWCKLTAVEVLEERDLPGKYIPIVKVTGNELVLPDGKRRLSGMIEQAMDPQREHNYAHAAFIQHVALAPRAPWVAPKEAIAGFEDDYADANRMNIGVLPYNHLDSNSNPMPPPSRTSPAGASTGWQAIIQDTEHGIEAAMGMYGPQVGAKSQEKSGVALQEQKQQGAISNYHFPDNLAKAIQQCGRILLEWIPKYYDTERVARILGEDGSEDMAYLNPEQEQAVMPRQNQFGEEVGSIYNLNVGTYDVTVATGPSYTAKRQEAAESQIQLIQAKPELMPIIGDIVFGNMDAPGSDKIAERLKAMLPPEIKQLEEKDNEGGIDAKLAQLQQGGQQLEQKAKTLFDTEKQLEASAMAMDAKAKEIVDQMADVEDAKKGLETQEKLLNSDRERFATEVKLANLQLKHDSMLERENTEKPETIETKPVNVYDSTFAQPIAQPLTELAQGLAVIAQAMAQNSQMIAQNTEIMAGMAQMANSPKRIINDQNGNPVGIEPVYN